MEWFPISSCSGHRFIRSLHYDLSWVAHSFIEFCKSLCHDEAVTNEEVLVIREMKIKTIKRCHLTTVKTSTIDIEGGGRTGREEEGVSTGEDVEKLEPLGTAGGTCKGTAAVENHTRGPQKLNTASPYDPELLSTCPELNTGSRCLDTHVDRAALFTKAKCPWRNKWISKGWPIQTTKYYSAFKKEGHSDTWTTRMNPEDTEQ